MPAAIDTLRFAKRLQGAGMAAPQAEAFAEAVSEGISEGLATKTDLAELRAELQQDIAELPAEMKQGFAELRAEIAAVEIRLLRWMGAGFVATIAILGAQIQLAHR
ncbi:MAG TPA: hypothetical protein VMV27_02595 [Candidatus Binataceae bacterium]|nr:hypothetical protein [Candidatus Binataceae bacterium]